MDGQRADVVRAVGLLQDASASNLIHETYLAVPAAPIGKPAAHLLHIELVDDHSRGWV